MEAHSEHFRFYTYTRQKLGYDANDIFVELQSVWPNDCPSERTIRRWCQDFREGVRTTLEDKERRGRPRTSRTDSTIKEVKELIEGNPKLSSRDLADVVGVGHSTILEILNEDLHMRNVCCVWVPHELSAENKQLRINCAKHIRQSLLHVDYRDIYAVEDETYVNFTPQASKAENRTWIHESAPRQQVVRQGLTNKKCLLMVAFTPNKRFSVSALPYGKTVDAECMVEFLRHTGDKWRTLRSSPIHLNDLLWQMDNARPHTARVVQLFMEQRRVQTVWQSPYSPDLNLCDRFLFRWMKSDLQGQTFHDHKEVEEAALHVLRDMSEESLVAEVQKLLDYCQLVIHENGEYVTE